jgi:hypothetical protein
MLSLLSNVTHWRNRAEEARSLAEHLTTGDARRVMLGIAEDYDRLAQGGEARIAASTRSINSIASDQAKSCRPSPW